MIRITDNDSIEVQFRSKGEIISASISLTMLKDLIMDEAIETISDPECNCSSCSVNGFCECDPDHENAEYAGIYLNRSSG